MGEGKIPKTQMTHCIASEGGCVSNGAPVPVLPEVAVAARNPNARTSIAVSGMKRQRSEEPVSARGGVADIARWGVISWIPIGMVFG